LGGSLGQIVTTASAIYCDRQKCDYGNALNPLCGSIFNNKIDKNHQSYDNRGLPPKLFVVNITKIQLLIVNKSQKVVKVKKPIHTRAILSKYP
jgi:hypothetical protein